MSYGSVDALVGKDFGPYRVVEKIGEGGMAVVYKGYQESLNRFVAIKVLREDLARDRQFVERFRREALAVARLKHPNILHVYDAGMAHGVYYIVMDYAPGGTLKDLLIQGAVDVDRAISIVAQVADALDYAHKHGLIHRDVKPSNILLTPEGQPQLTDFGIAKALHETTQLTRTGTSIGTPDYMSPEQIQGQSVDGRTDIYALGVVLYEMLSGRVPFFGHTPAALLYKQVHEQPPPVRKIDGDIPGWLQAILDKALEKQAEDRFQRASEMAQALRQQEAPAEARRGLFSSRKKPTPPERRSPTPIPRRRTPTTGPRPAARKRGLSTAWILGGAIALLLVILLVSAILLLSGGGGDAEGTPTPWIVTQVVTSEVVTAVVTSPPQTMREPAGTPAPAWGGSVRPPRATPMPPPLGAAWQSP